MSDVSINPGPVTDSGTGAYPMTRPAEVTVEAPVSNVPTGAVPAPPDEVTVGFPAGGEPTGAYPTPEAAPVYQWPGVTPDQPQAAQAAEAASAPADDGSGGGKTVTEAANAGAVEPDVEPAKPVPAKRTGAAKPAPTKRARATKAAGRTRKGK